MMTYIAFLRGINVGGKNKLPMSELRHALESADFKNVRTYIQSGNVVFESGLPSTDVIATSIGKIIEDTFGFIVHVLVKTKKQVEFMLSQSPYTREDQISANKTYFVLLFDSPSQQLRAILNAMTFPNEKFQVGESCVHLLCLRGYGQAKLTNNLIESKLKVIATTRNYRTIHKVLALV